MAQIRCEYCHEMIDEREFAAHEAAHRRARPDGQQTDYVTLPPEQREAGELAGVPRVYVHQKCGKATGMPEEIIRSYLKNPFLYSGGTFCTGCGKHVSEKECEWAETGENMHDYMERLRAEKPEMKPKGCFGAALVLAGLVVAGRALA